MSVAGGVKDLVPLQAEGTFSWLSTEGEDLGKIEKKLELAEKLEAPVAPGTRAGVIAYYLTGKAGRASCYGCRSSRTGGI